MRFPEAYWRAVLRRPDDDQPRLRLADWLDFDDPDRAEFIRLQCQLHWTSAHPELVGDLDNRERELLAQHELDWVGDLEQHVDYWVFQRGFVEEIALSFDSYFQHADAILAEHPIRELHLRGLRNRTPYLARAEEMLRYHSLDLSENLLRDQGVQVLARSPYLGNLRRLNLSSTGLGDDGLRALAESPHLGRLRELYLCDNRISQAGLSAFLNSPLRSRLAKISLRYNDLDAKSVGLLQESLGSAVWV